MKIRINGNFEVSAQSNEHPPAQLPGLVISVLQLLVRNSYSVYPTRKKEYHVKTNVTNFKAVIHL